MAVPTYPSAITLTDIQTEFGGSNPIGLNEYYSGGTYVGSGIANSTGTVIPTSGAINFLNFSGAISFPADPTQPTVTLDHWHGTWSWGNIIPGLVEITTTGHVVARMADGKTHVVLDGSGAKAWGNTALDTTTRTLEYSRRNPYYGYSATWRTTGAIITKISNTGIAVMSSNISWGSNTSYVYSMAPASGTANANTSLYIPFVSNTNFTNSTFTVCKVNATDMTTVEWAKTVMVTPADLTTNIRSQFVWTTQDESAIIVVGARGTTNTCVVILDAATGATQQNWQTVPSASFYRKPTSANNIAFSHAGINLAIKSNTGSNVANIWISNTSWRSISYGWDIDYDSSVYMYSGMQQGNTSTIHSMVAKYNTSGTRQWQLRIESVNSANGVIVRAFHATNNRVIVAVQEITESHDGKKWYTSGFGEVRYLYLDAASGNTGTMGRFILTSNTLSVWSAGTGNTGMWAYTYSPTSTHDFTLQSNTTTTWTANAASFTKTAL